MNLVEKIIDESFNQAALRNFEVITNVFGMPLCPDCDYPQNYIKFDRLLLEHTRHKIVQHRMKIRETDEYYNINLLISQGRYFHLNINTVVQDDKLLHEDLMKIWPCENCIKKYNPSKRDNQFPKRYPKQGVVNV